VKWSRGGFFKFELENIEFVRKFKCFSSGFKVLLRHLADRKSLQGWRSQLSVSFLSYFTQAAIHYKKVTKIHGY
jgi:hypothetical protein